VISHQNDTLKQQELSRDVNQEIRPVTGQVIHLKMGCLRMTASIDRVVQAEPPLIGQTIYGVSFLGEGSGVSSWARDQESIGHPHCRDLQTIRGEV